MKSSGKNISLTSYDDIFTTEASPGAFPLGTIVEIPLDQLHPFKNHPFRVVDDEHMQKTAESIRDYGVLVPGLVRPRLEGGYEIISGHRRRRASEIAQKKTMPVIIRDLDDDEATIAMVDSNLQRENILPSERAAAYQMKMEAIRRKAGRHAKENGDQVGHNFTGQKSVDIIAENAPDSRNQIQRFMRLNHLIKPLLDRVDKKEIAFTPAVELSYLKPEEQIQLTEAMMSEQCTPSLSQAQRLRKLSQDGELSPDRMTKVLSEVKKTPQKTADTYPPPATSILDRLETPENSQPISGFIKLPIEPFLKFIPKSLFQQQEPEGQEKLTRLFLKMAELYKKYIEKKRSQVK